MDFSFISVAGVSQGQKIRDDINFVIKWKEILWFYELRIMDLSGLN